MPEQLANFIGVGLEWVVAIAGGLLVAFWVGLVVWTWRDIRTRSSDIFAAILASLLVAIFNILGVLLYLLLRPKQTLAEQYDRALEEEALLREIEQAPTCHKCGRPVSAEWQFCPYCEAELRHPCHQCGYLLDRDWKRCPQCGAHPDQAPPQPAYVPPPPATTTVRVSEPVDFSRPKAEDVPLEESQPVDFSRPDEAEDGQVEEPEAMSANE